MVEADHVKEKLAAVGDPVFLLQTLFADAPVAFAIMQADGKFLVVNRAFEALFGTVPPPEYNAFKDELIAERGLTPYLGRVLAGEPVVIPSFWYDASLLQHVHVVGRRVAIEASMTPLKDRTGTVRHIALSVKDVTAERELENERRLLRILFEAAPEAIVTYDLDAGRFVDANDNAIRMFGYSRDALLRLGPADVSAPRQPDGRSSTEILAEQIERARRGEQLEAEWLFQTASGEQVPCEIRVVHVLADGRSLGRISMVDLRERKLVEAKRERVRELEAQNRRMHEANRLKSEFLAAMSHELRTPLNSIIGFAELVFDGRVAPGSPEHREFVGDILASARHLLQLINDILDLAKVEAGKLEFRPEHIVIPDVVTEVVGLLRTLALEKHLHIQIDADPSVAAVTLDPARFKQVLYNYLSNALKFTPDGGRIAVRTLPEGPGWFRLEVEDSGIGIAPEDIKRLFVEFQQLDVGRSKPPGTGLGLALTRRIVEAQGGSVGVRSIQGRGSVFHAILPRETQPIRV